MASTVEICNGGLQLVGENLIVDLTDASKEARQCSAAWDRVRQGVIRANPWNCTTKRAKIPKEVAAPSWGYDYSYPLPADCLRVFDIDTSDAREQWRVEGRKLLSDIDSPLGILYGFDETNSQNFDGMLVTVLSHALAVELVEPLTQSNTKRIALMKELEKVIIEAKIVDGQEQTPSEFEEDEWILARLRR